MIGIRMIFFLILLLRKHCDGHAAVNYLSMKRHPLVAASGVIDNEDDFVADMAAISLGEARAVLCVYMMCCALDGSSDKNEFELWKLLLAKVRREPIVVIRLAASPTVALPKVLCAESHR